MTSPWHFHKKLETGLTVNQKWNLSQQHELKKQMSHQDEFLYHRQGSADNLLLYSGLHLNSTLGNRHCPKSQNMKIKPWDQLKDSVASLWHYTPTVCLQNNYHLLTLIQNYFMISFSENKMHLSSLHTGILRDFSFLFRTMLCFPGLLS